MMDKIQKIDRVVIIKHQIDKALKEIEKLKNQTSTIRNAVDLEKFEKDIAKKRIRQNILSPSMERKQPDIFC
jgi:regulator of replication initiation timing